MRVLSRLWRNPTLRRIALWGGPVVAMLGLGFVGLLAWFYARADMSNVGELSFANRLHVPPVLEPRVDAQGRKIFDLRLQPGENRFRPGGSTSTWGVNGTYLGPTLRAARGDDVQVNVTNRLGETTTLHWHGMHVPAEADGNPHQPIDPGTTWSPQWTIDQPAATLWYHPHTHQLTADHVYRGLAGLFLLDDPAFDESTLPHTYGLDDVPVIIQDKRFHSNGELDFGAPTFSPIGILGPEILVNGTHDPFFEAVSDTVRLRLLNASNARVYNVGFDDERSFLLIGTDGGLLERPHSTRRVQISPGERAEIVVTLKPGDRPVLRSYPPELGLNWVERRFAGGDDTFDLLQVRAAIDLRSGTFPPDGLTDVVGPTETDAVTTRDVRLGGSRQINGRTMDMGRTDFEVLVGTTEIWEVRNTDDVIHNFHVHDVQFRILDYGGRPPPPHLGGWKDTVFLPPGQSARLLVQFTDYADATTPYMFHCHILLHEDSGMMAQFVVVEPGQSSALPAPSGHH